MAIKHLINDSVYAPLGKEVYPLPDCDGVELLTGYTPIQEHYLNGAVSVHLPYCTDWYGIWTGNLQVPEDIPDDTARYLFYGRDRASIIDSLHLAIDIASSSNPAYGILHAGSASINELLSKTYSLSDDTVLKEFAEIINTAVSRFPNGEPPFRLLFENQWWPGLRMTDGRNYRTLCDNIEFENWGLCLDTGHLLVTTKKSFDEDRSIELLETIFDTYPKDMIDSIMTIHLHFNDSGNYFENYNEPALPDDVGLMDLISMGYAHVCSMDQHRPFTSGRVHEITDILCPEYVTHEMGTPVLEDKRQNYLGQRSLFRQ